MKRIIILLLAVFFCAGTLSGQELPPIQIHVLPFTFSRAPAEPLARKIQILCLNELRSLPWLSIGAPDALSAAMSQLRPSFGTLQTEAPSSSEYGRMGNTLRSYLLGGHLGVTDSGMWSLSISVYYHDASYLNRFTKVLSFGPTGDGANPEAFKEIQRISKELISKMVIDRRESYKLVINLFDTHFPDAAFIVKKLEESLGKPMLSTAYSFNPAISLYQASQLATIAHENAHKYNATFNSVFLDKDTILPITRSQVFPSEEILETIPQALRTFRIKPYITQGARGQTTQIHGIYGLLDEWACYYFGTYTATKLLSYCRDAFAQTDHAVLSQPFSKDANYARAIDAACDPYLKYISSIYGIMYAHYEFKFFVLKYLQFAQTAHPEIYQTVMADQQFRAAVKMVNQRFEQLINAIPDYEAAVGNDLAPFGIALAHDPQKYLVYLQKVGPDGTTIRVSVKSFDDVVTLLKTELAKESYAQLSKELFE